MGFSPAASSAFQCRQVDPLQRADLDPGGRGRELSVLHDRAQHRQGCRSRSAARSPGRAGRIRQDRAGNWHSLISRPRPRRQQRRGPGQPVPGQYPRGRCDRPCPALLSRRGDRRRHPLRDAETDAETELMLADLDSLERRLDATAKKAKGKEAKVPSWDHRTGAGRTASRPAGARPETDRRAAPAVPATPTADRQTRALRLQCGKIGGGQGRCLVGQGGPTRRGGRLSSSSRRRSRQRWHSSQNPRRRPNSFRLGLEEPGPSRVIRAGYTLLDLVTFFTVRSRAWTVHRGAGRRRQPG